MLFSIRKKQTDLKYNNLRLGVVGCGRVFERMYLPALKRSKDWDLVAACDPSEGRRQWVGRVSAGMDIYNDFESFMDNSTADAVLIATPPEFHAAYSLRALEKGAHVLVEKPMALNSADGARMVETAAEQNKILWVAFQRRFRETYFRLKKQIRPVRADSVSSITYELMLSPMDWQSVSPFLGDDGKGGGIFDDVFSHQVNLMTWLLDSGVDQVRAISRQEANSHARHMVIDLLFQNGILVQCLAGHGKKYSEKLAVNFENRSLVVYPGHVLKTRHPHSKWADAYGSARTHFHHLWHKVIKTPNLTAGSSIRQLHNFASAIRGKPRHYRGSNGKEGLDCIEVIEACRRSYAGDGSWWSVENSGGD